jgi:hypothetical protein
VSNAAYDLEFPESTERIRSESETFWFSIAYWTPAVTVWLQKKYTFCVTWATKLSSDGYTIKFNHLELKQMGAEVIIFIALFSVVFGIAYLYFSTRNQERLALIEKGMDASIFLKGRERAQPFWKVLILNLALLLMGIGAGVMLGGTLAQVAGVEWDIAMPGSIFLLAGTGLLIGFFITRKMERED